MFIPMEAEALSRYGFMRRLGVFGIEQQSARGAVAFLRTAQSVLANPGHMLWMNAPGRFCDVRERPVPIAPGLTRLAELAPDARFLPRARLSLLDRGDARDAGCFGPPIPAAELAALDRDARAGRLRICWRR